jgi:hypothetical protein
VHASVRHCRGFNAWIKLVLGPEYVNAVWPWELVDVSNPMPWRKPSARQASGPSSLVPSTVMHTSLSGHDASFATTEFELAFRPYEY